MTELLTYAILLGFLAVVFFLFLIAFRAYLDFKAGMKKGRNR